jgi:hypothetical protein
LGHYAVGQRLGGVEVHRQLVVELWDFTRNIENCTESPAAFLKNAFWFFTRVGSSRPEYSYPGWTLSWIG